MIEFTAGQRKTIACGVTVLSLALVVSFVGFLGWLAVKTLSYMASALVPVVVGFFLALFFKPYYQWWKRVLRNPSLALIAMLLTVCVPLGLVLWSAGAVLIDQISHLIAQGPDLFRQVLQWFQQTFPKLNALLTHLNLPADGMEDVFLKYGATAFKAGTGALKVASGVLSVLVTLIFFVFFLMTKDRRGSEIVSQMPFLKESTRGFVAKQIDVFVEILVSFFQRQVVICLIEGVMYGTGFWAVGLPYGFLLGFLLGVLNLIPLFGSVVCLPIALPLAYFAQGGSTTRLILVLSVWVCGQALDGYFITPKIQGDKTGLGYAGVIFSFFFWGIVLGPLLGLLLAIPLSAFCVVLWRSLKATYIQPIV